MLHAKFEGHMTLGIYDLGYWKRRFLKVLTIYGHCGHLGYVTKIIFTKFMFPLPKEASH